MPVLALAPMAGVGNWVFRLICARLGARVVGVEFINCRVVSQRSARSEHRAGEDIECEQRRREPGEIEPETPPPFSHQYSSL